ncbi:MAG: AmmeMemoRadiSam system protein B [Deltaproteobacteria bacterium]|nr:AmmeMemoRadiSam system protein B [Deltaproteobacteria bacterium]
MSRKPAVANMFYPGDKTQLMEQLEQFIKPDPKPRTALAAISPHAGYMYSGHVAGAVFSKIKIPETVVILGPNHRGMGARAALASSGSWETPLGTVPINETLARYVLDRAGDKIQDDPQVHVMEHSIEVQVPFLQALRPDVTIVPVCISYLPLADCESIGLALAETVRDYGNKVLFVASTDMTHYESQETAKTKDQLAIDRILELDPRGLYNVVAKQDITMCGVMPTTILLTACKALGSNEVELVQYTTSGEVTGDYAQVVGYAGFIIY